MPIVDVALFKAHLRLGSAPDEDVVLQTYLDHAEALVLDYVRQRVGDEDAAAEWEATVATWAASPAPADIPAEVPAAILRMATDLYRFRGDDTEGNASPYEPGTLPAHITTMLYRFRDPAFYDRAALAAPPRVPALCPGGVVVCAARRRERHAGAARRRARPRRRRDRDQRVDRAAPWADVLYACDARWWLLEQGAPTFTGHNFALEPGAARWPGVVVLRTTGHEGLERTRPASAPGATPGIRR